MRELRRLWLHVVLFVLAAVLAFWKARPEVAGARQKEPTDVQMWAGKPSAIRHVGLETPKKRVTLDSRADATGQWFVGSEKPLDAALADGGAPDAGAPPKSETTFVSVGVAQKLVEKCAPMIAKRSVGEVSDERSAAFGFDKPFGTLTIQLSETVYELEVGGTTPGGADRYVRNKDGKVFAIDGSIVRDLDGGAARLRQQDLHEFRLADKDVDGVRIKVSDKKADVVRSGPDGRRFWARKDKPDDKDEQVGNWLDKLDRLKPSAYVEDKGDAELVLRVEYLHRSDVLGFAELYKRGDDYLVTTELLRWYGTLTKASAEQVAQDVASMVE